MRRLYHERLEKKAFRMSIVLMLRDLGPRERAQTIAELTSKEFSIPYSDKTTISRTTIYEWLREYRQTRVRETVLLSRERSDRESFRGLSDIQKNSLMVWRSGNKYRTIAQLREELMAHEETCAGYIPSESTIGRFLKSVGLDRQTLLRTEPPVKKVRLSYEASYPQQLWLADTKGPNLHVKDPRNPGKTCIAVPVIYMDDNSRYLPAFKYIYKDEENEDTIMRMFMGAVYLFGVPDILYLDRGGPYMGHRLKRSAELLGCRVTHTSKKDAPAKGKIEKMMRYFYEKLECELMTRPGPMTIEEANTYMAAIVCQDYHRREHSSTGQSPEDRFFAYPAEYRRFVSKKALSKIFLPYSKSHVSKTGLIRINKREYLIPDCLLYGKYVEVRWDACDISMIYVWHEDRFIGEAYLYHAENDFIKRQQLEESMVKRLDIALPDPEGVPLYGYLERKLAAHRLEAENLGMNDELAELRVKRAKIKAELTRLPQTTAGQESAAGEFTADRLVHLLSVLLRRMLSAHERLAVHMTWQKYGPFDEAQARKTVGTLLGENHPVSDLTGYLDALRITAMTTVK